MSYKVLVVDNEAADLECTRLVLSDDPDFELTCCLDSDEAISLVKENPNSYSAILLDYQMPKNGIETAKEMLAVNPHLVIAMNSSDDSREVLKKCMNIGVSDFIEKSQEEDVVRGIVRSLCQKWEENGELFQEKDDANSNQEILSAVGLIGRSQGLVNVARLIKNAAKSNCNIFIRGESGTGKELVAKAIHNLSNRRNHSFVAVNVNALSENIVESLLFGHKKGSFTGALADSEGLIRSAHQGTLFLDEIGDLKPEIQVKLLRAIQEKCITPVGSTKSVPVDIRIISATHVNIEKAMEDGKFREDLYYRLHLMPVRVPPLRERKEDIMPLFNFFLKMHKLSHLNVLKKTAMALEAYNWKGNVRELQNEVDRIVALQKSRIAPDDLSPNITGSFEPKLNGLEGYSAFIKKQEQEELAYLKNAVLMAGSLREASKNTLKMPLSSLATRLNKLDKNKGVPYEFQ